MTDSVNTSARTTPPNTDPLADRAVRLFTFLGQAQQLRTPRVHDLDSYTRDGAVHWLHAVPLHAAIRCDLSGATVDPGAPVLTVERVPRVAPPPPPTEIIAWIDGGIDDAHTEPSLFVERFVPDSDPDRESGTTVKRTDLPEIGEQYERYLVAWRSWAETERHDEVARTFYGDLFSTYVTATGHSEELEIVLAAGLLAWRPPEHPAVRRHLLTTTVVLSFDDDSGRLSVTVGDAATPSRVELEMLDPALITNPALVNGVREDVAVHEIHPLDRDRTAEYARRLVHSLAADAEYHDADEPASASAHPVAAFAPALLLRRRTQQGLVEIFRRITEQISTSGQVPAGLRPLIDPDEVPPVRTDGERTDGAAVRVDDELFLPLPVNDVQRRILARVDSNAQTLIQGPPGTGKTHTAAALISHLLAQGKRVLVTAHTDRALREVRGKLPDPIKPLAVSVVGSSREDMADLRVAVERIAAAAGDHDEPTSRREIEHRLSEIDRLRRERASLYNSALDARRHEVDVHEIAEYRGTLAAITLQLADERDRLSWLDDLPGRTEGPPPLSNGEMQSWRARLLDPALHADEPAATRRLVDASALVVPEQFADLVTAEERALAYSTRFDALRRHRSYAALARLDQSSRVALVGRLHDVRRMVQGLARRREPWIRDAMADVLGGRSGTWLSRRATIGGLLEESERALQTLGPVVDVRAQGDPAELEHLARSVLTFLEGGGSLKLGADGVPRSGVFTPRVVKQAAQLFDRVRVNGVPPTDTTRLKSFLVWLDGSRILDALDRAWPTNVVIHAEDTLHERYDWHRSETGLLDRVLGLAEALSAEEDRLVAAGVPAPHWPDSRDLDAVIDLPTAIDAEESALAATSVVGDLADRLEIGARRPDAEAAVGALLDAVRRRERAAYDTAFRRIDRLHTVREEIAERDSSGRRLRAAAPELHDAIVSDPMNTVWDERLPGFEQAWNWAVAAARIACHNVPEANTIQRNISDLDDRIRGQVQHLAATRAWSHAVSPGRLTRGSRASLEQYAALVRRFGKTGGQYRVQRAAEIRDAMDRCRPAVPVWIMPLYRIADQLTIAPDMFDVVIVDEASQAGLEASFLQYLAPRIVVIGDDKQVSPAAVGVDQQQLRDLAGQYLYDHTYRATWPDPQVSLFDLARMFFEGMLTLVEHRRCVPEIIGFSNRIAYEPANVRLIPVRQFGADRLEPVKPVFVENGYEKGGSTTRVNPAEVDAIVAQIEACIEDPRYAGLTFGVISLLGTAQAKAIEKKLLERVLPEQWAERDLRCGDAADFQGSERDVMFLSMVAVPTETRRITALTQPANVQRFNVAASRAKDQMWVFHSVRLDQLHNPEDMRFALLDYCYGVARRGEQDDSGTVAGNVPDDQRVSPFDSLFEQRVCNRLVDRGYAVVPQYPALGYSIDLVVTGATARLAIECDGDFWHGPDAYQRDLARQRELERCDWTFVRVLESEFYLDPARAMAPIWDRLAELGIHPSGWTDPAATDVAAAQTGRPGGSVDLDDRVPVVRPDTGQEDDAALPTETEVRSPGGELLDRPMPTGVDTIGHPPVGSDDYEPSSHPTDRSKEVSASGLSPAHDENRADSATTPSQDPGGPPAEPPDANSLPERSSGPAYTLFSGRVPAADAASRAEIVDGLVRIVQAEGPLLGHRLHQAYVAAAGGARVGSRISTTLNQALDAAVRRGVLVRDNPLRESGNKPCTYRLADQPEVLVRDRGPRGFDQLPPAELAAVMADVADDIGWDDRTAVFRATIARYGLVQVGSAIRQRLTSVMRLVPGAPR
ncbi:AAA domain-containing protein [Pseudonocardia tropica]|uniref:AAA domain-containing protein n=1 Tax=Pseudonocardia tropica TaxID=681289 RepID=A0ABV1JSH1_9PSEU